MTDQEREQVLKMIESGKISPEDGLKLMRTLDQSPAEDENPTSKSEKVPETGPDPAVDNNRTGSQPGKTSFENDPRIARVKSTGSPVVANPLMDRYYHHHPERMGNVCAGASCQSKLLVLLPERPPAFGCFVNGGSGRQPESTLAVCGCAPETRGATSPDLPGIPPPVKTGCVVPSKFWALHPRLEKHKR